MATITRNEEKNGIEITFAEKPSQEVIDWLREHKFRFSPFGKKWYKKFTEADLKEVKEYFKS